MDGDNDDDNDDDEDGDDDDNDDDDDDDDDDDEAMTTSLLSVVLLRVRQRRTSWETANTRAFPGNGLWPIKIGTVGWNRHYKCTVANTRNVRAQP